MLSCSLACMYASTPFPPLYPAQEDCSEVLGRLRELEPRIEMQLSHLRGDIKGALATAAASSRAEMEAEAGQRVKEAEKRLSLRLQGGWVGMEALKYWWSGTRLHEWVGAQQCCTFQILKMKAPFLYCDPVYVAHEPCRATFCWSNQSDTSLRTSKIVWKRQKINEASTRSYLSQSC